MVVPSVAIGAQDQRRHPAARSADDWLRAIERDPTRASTGRATSSRRSAASGTFLGALHLIPVSKYRSRGPAGDPDLTGTGAAGPAPFRVLRVITVMNRVSGRRSHYVVEATVIQRRAAGQSVGHQTTNVVAPSRRASVGRAEAATHPTPRRPRSSVSTHRSSTGG